MRSRLRLRATAAHVLVLVPHLVSMVERILNLAGRLVIGAVDVLRIANHLSQIVGYELAKRRGVLTVGFYG